MAETTPKAVIFDLDAAIIDSRRAWKYALEEAVMMVTGERIDPSDLAEGYEWRPWEHVVPIVVHGRDDQNRCLRLCERYYRRSALKWLLVFEGIGMALDQVRGELIEMGGITRETHADAMRQIESTGIDRFLSVLSPTNDGVRFEPAERFAECITYLECPPSRAVYVSPFERDLREVADTGAATALASWTTAEATAPGGMEHPSELPESIREAVVRLHGGQASTASG